MTLLEIQEKHPKILNEFEAQAKPYCTRLFDLGEGGKGTPDFIASGTFVRIGGRSGILTNHHVAMVFEVKKRSWIYVPEYKSTKILPLKFELIISLPHYPINWGLKGVDISFILLTSEDAITNLGYKIWDLDESAKRHFTQKINFRKKGNVNNWLWGIEATPSEKVSKLDGMIYFEQSGFHFLGPDKADTFIATARCSLGNLVKKVDELYCEINREGKDGPKLPNSYGGTSGSALWRGIGELPQETIKDFDLAGIVIEEIKFAEGLPAVAIMCLGSNSLFETFYKFCSHYLLHQEEVTALRYAGFVNE